jgi:hypothetical protein
MKYRILAIFVLSVLVFTLGGSTFADSKTKKGNGSELVSLLPASDGVVILDIQRFFGEALPRLLSGNQPMFDKITGEIEKFQSKSGIDIRQFDSIAAGVTTRTLGAKKYEVEPVIIARGQISSAALIGAAKLASDGKYTEETIGDRVIYIFPTSKIATGPVGTEAKKLDEKIAVTAIDSTTIAFGSLPRVRQTVEAKTKVGLDITSLLNGNPNAVTSFAGKMPAGMKSFVPLENDELGKTIDSIRYVYGNADVIAESANVHVAARTLSNADAKGLFDTLNGLQMLGKAFLGGAKGDDKKVYARMIESVKFSTKANEVMIDLQVPQSDIDILVGKLK